MSRGGPRAAVHAHPSATARELGQELLDREVHEFMTPGCVAISEDATVAQAADALAAHRVHAVLVVGALNGTPLGWVTARSLFGWLDRDRSLASAREAVTEQVTAVEPNECLRVALSALAPAGTTRLLVRRTPHELPQGVLSEFDLAIAARS